MKVTLKEIASIAGVSKGTVDRALYNRPGVNKEVAQKIKDIANELGYKPNKAARAISKAKNPVKIGVILQSAQTPFMQEVKKGTIIAQKEIAEFGGEVFIKEINSNSCDDFLTCFNDLVEIGANGICMLPVESEDIANYINDVCFDKKIKIVTVNSDYNKINRLCYIGQDNQKGGQTSAEIMKKCVKSGKILIISSYRDRTTHVERSTSFIEYINEEAVEIDVLPIKYCYDNDAVAKKITLEEFATNIDIKAIYSPANGYSGISQALKELGLQNDVFVVVHDTVPATVEFLREGIVDFIIDQDAFAQGHDSVNILFDNILQNTQPESQSMFTEIKIIMKTNL